MWICKRSNDETTKYLISERKSYTVGRRNCDFVFEEDLSISRKHCTLHIAKQSECPFQVGTSTGVWLVDEQSKYGTFVRNNNTWIKVTPSQNFKISHGFVIRFGLMENIWRFEYKPLIICTSGISTSQKNKIACTLKAVDGELKNCWHKECMLVVVNEVTLTVKVVLALILGVAIVTPNYIEKVVDSIKNQTALPRYEDHRPSIKESALDASLVSLDVKNNRRELFKGKQFLIPTKTQLKALKEVITSAGGNVELLSLNGSWQKFAEENTIVIQSPLNDNTVPDSLTKSIKEIAMYLRSKHNKRVIPESEIAQAVAYSSTEKYCNPRSSCFSLNRVQMKQPQGDTLVEETPDMAEEKVPDSLFVQSSATLNSQWENIPEAHCSKSSHNGAPLDLQSERKRPHSPVQINDCQTKKPRNGGKNTQNISIHVLENSADEPNQTQGKSECDRVDSSKSHKQGEKTIQQDTSDFWNYKNYTLKRKSSTRGNADGETSKKRQMMDDFSALEKLKSHPSSEFELDTPREAVEVVEAKNSAPFPIARKIIEEGEDFTVYFGKENDCTKGKFNGFDNTIFFATLISSAYLKADGTLIEPPAVLVNVKKFKKQKIQSITVDPTKEPDDLSDGEWIEPHPREVTVGD